MVKCLKKMDQVVLPTCTWQTYILAENPRLVTQRSASDYRVTAQDIQIAEVKWDWHEDTIDFELKNA